MKKRNQFYKELVWKKLELKQPKIREALGLPERFSEAFYNLGYYLIST